MRDFQDILKRIVEDDDPAGEPAMDPIGAPDSFNIGHHKKNMAKSTDPGDVLQRHLEAQAFEFKKLKNAYDQLVAAVQEVLGGLGSYGIENKGFMKGMKPMSVPQGTVSNQSTAQAMAGANQFRQKLNTPITPDLSDI